MSTINIVRSCVHISSSPFIMFCIQSNIWIRLIILMNWETCWWNHSLLICFNIYIENIISISFIWYSKVIPFFIFVCKELIVPTDDIVRFILCRSKLTKTIIIIVHVFFWHNENSLFKIRSCGIDVIWYLINKILCPHLILWMPSSVVICSTPWISNHQHIMFITMFICHSKETKNRIGMS